MNDLKRVSGIVQNLRVEKGYRDLIFSKIDGQAAGLAAVGAAAAEQGASSTILSAASTGNEIGMDFFSCTIDASELRGAFHKVEFHDGDYMEFVVEPAGKFSTVHAARNPGTRILWMQPHQVRCHVAQKLCDMRWSLLYPLLAVVQVGISEFFIDKDYGTHGFFAELFFYSLVFGVTFVITMMIRLRFKGFARQVTEVLRAFGYERPEKVDLWQLHKKAQRALAASTNTLPPLVKPWSYRY